MKMKIMTKKMVAGVVAGAVLLTGGLSYVQAARDNSEKERVEFRGPAGHRQPPQMNREEMAGKIADTFKVSKDEVLKAMDGKEDFRNIGHAAMLAKISGKSFQEVLSMKTKDNHWGDVQKSLGITGEQMKDEMDSLTAERIAGHGNVGLDTAKKLLKNGYDARDIEMAGILAKASGKDLQSVLDMKKINNHWKDVANSLGVDEGKLRLDRWGHDAPDGMMPPGGPEGMHGRGGLPGEPPHEAQDNQ